MKHIFPFAEIEKGKRIVLYGASERGYDFYRQLVSTEYGEIVLWVDRQYEWYRYLNLPVEPPGKISEVDYDLIVVTAEQKNVFNSIRDDLLRLGAAESSIFWKEDCLITGNIAAGYDKERIEKEAVSAFLLSPYTFLDKDRLDIVVRVKYASDILDGKEKWIHRSLYRRLMMAQNNGKEPTENMISAFFSEYSIKRGFKAFDDAFRDVILSMNTNGFRRDCFIPVDRSKKMINGAHRVAAAIATGVDVWAYEYPVNIKPLVFDEKWFTDNGFLKSETDYIKECYLELIG